MLTSARRLPNYWQSWQNCPLDSRNANFANFQGPPMSFYPIFYFNLAYPYIIHIFPTLESGIDVGQGITVGPGKIMKKNKRRALNKRRA